ncbi:MAG: DUF4272 domain-containing protein [Desulfomonile tiedjei]|nr:DUF4272 domain-containing protein [Desulfomonile tiedjei]
MEPEERKEASETLLKRKGIPYNPGLPCIESEEETELRTAEKVGIRIFCLHGVIGSAYYPSYDEYKQYLRKHQLWDYLSPDEIAFLSGPTPSAQMNNKFTWRVEALFVLMWAVRLFDRLPWPDHQMNNDEIVVKFPELDESPWPFIRRLRLRPKPEIMDASDLIYRLRWACDQAYVEGQPPPGCLDPDVLIEWHHAINWITKYDDDEWDRVPIDT